MGDGARGRSYGDVLVDSMEFLLGRSLPPICPAGKTDAMRQFWVGTRAGRAWVLAAVLLLSCVGLAVHPQRAAACSCRGLSTATALRQADVAFSGEAS